MSSDQNSGQPTTSTTTTTTTTTTVSSNRRNGNNNTLTTTRTVQPIVNSGEASRSSVLEPFPALQSEPISRIPSNTLRPVASTSSPAFRSTIGTPSSRRRPIGIQRLSSNDLSRQTSRTNLAETGNSSWTGRRRSASAPQRPGLQLPGHDEDGNPLQRISTAGSNLAPVIEDDGQRSRVASPDHHANRPSRSGSKRMRQASDAAKSAISRLSGSQNEPNAQQQPEYESEVVDLLDVLDPEVAALTTLTNVQNSLFVPDLGWLLNRRPTYTLSRSPSRLGTTPETKPLPPTPGPLPPISTDTKTLEIPSDIDEEATPTISRRERRGSGFSIDSHVHQQHFAVLPHGVSLEGWSEEEKEMLDDHVRHMLHSKRSKFKRTMRAFGKYVRRPLGFFVTLYATLITLFGLAWVLFLIGWIYVGDRQPYIINVIDNVLVALFAIVGDGMAPFRAVDTYHMIFIAHYHHLSWRLRKEKALPKLQDHNDLPAQQPEDVDMEAMKYEDTEFSVLTQEQQKKLEHHQNKFCKSHSFYKPHETTTHHAFPLRLLVAIVVLLDCHSLFQIALGAVTWGINYHVRPAALTATILSCSITVNIVAGILIKVGDGKTRKKDVLKRMYRQELTQEAMKKVEKKVERSGSREEEQETEREQSQDEKQLNSYSPEVTMVQNGRALA